MLALTGCRSHFLHETLDEKLSHKSFELYETKNLSLDSYEEILPDDLDMWYETKAVLQYKETVAPSTYVYILAYQAPKSKKKDLHDEPIVHITHLLKTHVRFVRYQTVKIRYAEKEPLLFEWVTPLKTCPDM